MWVGLPSGGILTMRPLTDKVGSLEFGEQRSGQHFPGPVQHVETQVRWCLAAAQDAVMLLPWGFPLLGMRPPSWGHRPGAALVELSEQMLPRSSICPGTSRAVGVRGRIGGCPVLPPGPGTGDAGKSQFE